MPGVPLFLNHIPCIADSGGVSLGDILDCDASHPWHTVVLSNYMIDMDWVFMQSPLLAQVPRLLVLSGEQDTEHIKNAGKKWAAGGLSVMQPKLPIPFGTHHTKMILAFCASGLRLAVVTANFHCDDWERKNQMIYCQDFPLSVELCRSAARDDLLEYLRVVVPRDLCELVSRHDFTSCRARFVGSVPGYHKVENGCRFGLQKFEHVLREESKQRGPFSGSKLQWQYSSQGSLTPAFLEMMELTMTAHGPSCEVHVRYPTEHEVRDSVEGWRAGMSIPVPMKNFHPLINTRLHKWVSPDIPRSQAMPHMKTYIRHNGSSLDWILVTSSNLSRAAWGDSQKHGTQLMIRSYELGVLVVGNRGSAVLPKSGFSCTKVTVKQRERTSRFWKNLSIGQDETVSLPFDLRPVPYSKDMKSDVPWAVDAPHVGVDALGQRIAVCGTHSHYGETCWKALVRNVGIPTEADKVESVGKSAGANTPDGGRIEVIDVDELTDSDVDQLEAKRTRLEQR